MDLSPRNLTGARKYVATGAVALGVLLGAAGISAAATGSTATHRQTTTSRDVPEAGDHADVADTHEANDTPDSPDTPEANDTPDSPDTPEANDTPDTPTATAAANPGT